MSILTKIGGLIPTKLNKILGASLLALACSGTVSHAITMQWTIGNAFMNDGTPVTGSFTYDSVADAYSDINIVTATGTFATFRSGNDQFLNAVTTTGDLTGTRVLYLDFYQVLPGAPGTFASGIIYERTCADVTCSAQINTPYKQTLLGTANYTGAELSTVPLPATLPLLAAGLGLMGFLRRGKAIAATS